MAKKKKSFSVVANHMVDELYSYQTFRKYSKSELSRIDKMKVAIQEDRKKFVRMYKRFTGATDWDLPDIIYAES